MATSAFAIFQVTVTDRDLYREYETAGHPEILDGFSGRIVAIDEDIDVVEGAWNFTRTVIVEFPSKEQARAWYNSDSYQAVVGLRHRASEGNLVIVGGLPSVLAEH